MTMKQPNRTDRGTAFSHPSIRSSMLVEPCFDSQLPAIQTLPVDYRN